MIGEFNCRDCGDNCVMAPSCFRALRAERDDYLRIVEVWRKRSDAKTKMIEAVTKQRDEAIVDRDEYKAEFHAWQDICREKDARVQRLEVALGRLSSPSWALEVMQDMNAERKRMGAQETAQKTVAEMSRVAGEALATAPVASTSKTENYERLSPIEWGIIREYVVAEAARRCRPHCRQDDPCGPCRARKLMVERGWR